MRMVDNPNDKIFHNQSFSPLKTNESASKLTTSSQREFQAKMLDKLKGWVDIDFTKETDEQIHEILNCGLFLDQGLKERINEELKRREQIIKGLK